MDDVQIDLIYAEPSQALLSLGVGVLAAGIELGCEEYLLARHAAVMQRPADALLVAIRLRGVDVAIPELERPANRVLALGTVGHLPDAETEQRYLVAVGEPAGTAIARGAHRLLVARILGGVRIVLAAHVAVAAIEQLEHLGHVGRAAQAMADAG